MASIYNIVAQKQDTRSLNIIIFATEREHNCEEGSVKLNCRLEAATRCNSASCREPPALHHCSLFSLRPIVLFLLYWHNTPLQHFGGSSLFSARRSSATTTTTARSGTFCVTGTPPLRLLPFLPSLSSCASRRLNGTLFTLVHTAYDLSSFLQSAKRAPFT